MESFPQGPAQSNSHQFSVTQLLQCGPGRAEAPPDRPQAPSGRPLRLCPAASVRSFKLAYDLHEKSEFARVRHVQRSPFDPDTAARRRPGARDGRQTLARQQQWFHLLAQRAAAIQFSLPVDWTCLSDRHKHRHHHHCGKCLLHVSLGVPFGRAHVRNLYACGPDKV